MEAEDGGGDEGTPVRSVVRCRVDNSSRKSQGLLDTRETETRNVYKEGDGLRDKGKERVGRRAG